MVFAKDDLMVKSKVADKYLSSASGRFFARHIAILLGIIIMLTSCYTAEQPKYYEVFEVSGSAYQRGYLHGKHFSNKIRSLYTMLLTSSIFPYLNRERPDVASVLLRYQEEKYLNGQFSYNLMLESGKNLLKTIPQEYIDELHGVADGASLPFEQILILNTFFDTMMAFRSITLFIKLVQSPVLLSVEFLGDLDSDGKDNNSDGVIDEKGEGLIDPYEPSPYAGMVEVPIDAKIRFILDDKLEGVDPATIRIQLNDKVYTAGDECIRIYPYAREGKTIEVIFTPPGGLPKAAVVPLIIQAYDLNRIVDPPPIHARFMRDERITFTTEGYGAKTYEVANRGVSDGRTQPPSIGFAVKDDATKDGHLLVAHHFAMLDANASHKHTVLFVHHLPSGKSFAFLGWAGVIWGFSGMNSDGLVYLVNSSDTLNNPFVDQFNKGLIFAELLSSGVPVGIMGREMLAGSADVDQALGYLEQTKSTFGWNMLLADKNRRTLAVELDSNITNDSKGGCFYFTPDSSNPDNLDQWGRPLGSAAPGDLHIASHYQRNLDDIDYQLMDFHVRPQRYWSSFYFRSLRAFYNLGNEISNRYGRLDLQQVIEVLRDPNLVDIRDSMNAAVYEPELLKIHFAMGQVPATSGPFMEFDFSGEPQR